MQIYIIAIVVLAILLCASLLYLIALKRQLKNVQKELEKNRDEEYNRLVSIQLLDKDMTALAVELNHNLDYQKQLKRAQKQQENRTKQSISDIAHDLRTPLTVVKGNLQMLEKSEVLTKKEQEYIRISQQKTEELTIMVDDFFELSVLESDAVPVELQKVNITNLLIQFLVDNEILIKEKGLLPEIDLPEKTLWIQAEEQMVYRMLSNLLGNIIKYAKGSFCVALKEQDNSCTLVFSNPVAANQHLEPEHLFDRSYMGDASRNRKGNGLGLYIVKLLADKQGAKVSASLKENALFIELTFACLADSLCEV